MGVHDIILKTKIGEKYPHC